MPKVAAQLDYELYNESCDFEDLKNAVSKLTQATEAQFQEIKKEKWYHRLFNTITFSKKNEKRMAEQISSLAQAQNILMEILVRLSSTDTQVAELVQNCMGDIRRLQKNDEYLLQQIKRLESICYGIRKTEDVRELSGQDKVILSGCLRLLSRLYPETSEKQKQYANALLNYLGEDGELDNLEVLSEVKEDSRRKMLLCMMEYMFLADTSAELSKGQEGFIDEFNIGAKTCRALQKRIEETYALRGADGLIDKYVQPKVENVFYVDIDDSSEKSQTTEHEDSGHTTESTSSSASKFTSPNPTSEITISSIQHIAPGKKQVYRNQTIHFQAKIDCEGTLEFEGCVLHYNESGKSDEIRLARSASIAMRGCKVVNHGYDEQFFIEAEGRENDAELSFANCEFVSCCFFLEGYRNVRLEKCKMVDIGDKFLYCTSASTTVLSECEFSFLQRPSFFPKENENNVITGYTVEMSQCVANGALQVTSPEAIDKILSNGDLGIASLFKKDYPLFDITKGSIKNSSFCGLKHLFSFSWYSDDQVLIAHSTFEHCADCMSSGRLKIDDCRFNHCTKTCTGLRKGSKVLHCQFNNCVSQLLTTGYDGGVEVSFCEFNNWQAPKERVDSPTFTVKMMEFSRTKDSDSSSSSVENCSFTNALVHSGFLIAGDAHEALKGVAVRVEKCNFQNCVTERDSKKLIREYDTYYGLFDIEKSQKVASIYDCTGWMND